ncbi:cathepsin L, putative [Perkinsus marinus ATCC 50983]|uniref:Cathepsin L, putative n=2 Tax=Perkinsus marinus (strain ATCC 50983 / TXsc) TaxID=423536 RepID=C5LFL5_PERM5|nr:cathepsin L, putative [Perkinsus marinus ATCC 50983]EER04489.1 cathepsin L, putative [Perkinsus marinus ATCC 50983]|eukprot:XP_002772673.1 cathepsin L, putative [Perkinsus marinus ATCC 50983]
MKLPSIAFLGSAVLSYEVPDVDLASAFAKFKEDYGIEYSSPQEAALREEIFIENYRHIQRINSEGRSYKLAVNKFADQSSEEFAAGMLTRGYRKRYRDFFGKRPGYLGVHHYSGKPLPDEIDWSHLGAVSRVKNQQSCGSCWAFSATGALEGRYEIANPKHELVEFSEQQLVDCSSEEGNMGCNGGLMDNAFAYVMQHGLCTEEDYAYEAIDEPCRNSTVKEKARLHPHDVTGFVDVHSKDGEAMKEALQSGPVSVAIEADMPDFQFYHEGVLTGECGDSLDHGVLLVGYGELDGKKYWKVKNSWGAEWGHEGYILLERERADGTEEDECGILLQGSYPKFREDIDHRVADKEVKWTL